MTDGRFDLPKKLTNLFPKFSSLSFKEKLKFWERHKINFATITLVDNNTRQYISIEPKSIEDVKLYFQWFIEKIKLHAPDWDLDLLKLECLKTIKDNILAIEFTKKEIEKTKKSIDRHLKLDDSGYKEGYNSILYNREVNFNNLAIKNTYNVDRSPKMDWGHHNLIGLQTGINNPSYLHFLNENLKILERGDSEIYEETKEITKSIVMISYLQMENLFPKYDTRKGISKASVENFVAKLINAKKDTVRQSFHRLKSFNKIETATTASVTHRIEILKDIRADFEKLNLEKAIAHIEKQIESLKKKAGKD